MLRSAVAPSRPVVNLIVVPDWGGATYDTFLPTLTAPYPSLLQSQAVDVGCSLLAREVEHWRVRIFLVESKRGLQRLFDSFIAELRRLQRC